MCTSGILYKTGDPNTANAVVVPQTVSPSTLSTCEVQRLRLLEIKPVIEDVNRPAYDHHLGHA